MNIFKTLILCIVSCALLVTMQAMENQDSVRLSTSESQKKELYSPLKEHYQMTKCPCPTMKAYQKLTDKQRRECYLGGYYKSMLQMKPEKYVID